MSIIGKPFNHERTKFCFAYCGPDRCDCGLTSLRWKHPPHDLSTRGIEEKKDTFDDAMDIVKKSGKEKC